MRPLWWIPLFVPVDTQPPSRTTLAARWADVLQTEVQYLATHRTWKLMIGFGRARRAWSAPTY
jgi:hypothetical protein